MTQVDLSFDGIRVQTSQDRTSSTELVAHELVFHWLTEAQRRFPLSLRIDRYTHTITLDEVPTEFDTYALEGQVAAIAAVEDCRVTVRCSEETLETIELVRLGRREVEEIVDQGAR
jgi:hypothetical protein